MNSKGIKAIEDTSICMKCLKKKATHFYNINGRGYGSDFDNDDTHFQLCDDCHKEEYDTWVNEKPKLENYEEDYRYEDDIINFIKSLPLESQELFYGRFNSDNYGLEGQDWIDYKLDELPHDKCKEYGLYSSQEKQAYKERFPNCDKVYIKKYRDGSCCTECSKGAFGNLDGICKSNISDECYMCTNYKPKTSEMKIVNECDEYYKNEKYRLENMIEYANKRLKELENDVKKYMDDHDCCNDEYDICVIEKRSSSDTGKRYSVEDLEKLILEQ